MTQENKLYALLKGNVCAMGFSNPATAIGKECMYMYIGFRNQALVVDRDCLRIGLKTNLCLLTENVCVMGF